MHEDLVNLVRCDLVPRLWECGYPGAGCTLAEIALQKLTGHTRYGPQPDAALWPGTGEPYPPLVVEIGRYNPAKWDASVPVLHVSFSGHASLINTTGREFEFVVLDQIRALLCGRN